MAYLDKHPLPELEKKIVEEGTGEDRPRRFDKVKILYQMVTLDGVFISETTDPTAPLETKVGDADLMKGMNIALTTMRVGERAEFTIPPELTYEPSAGEEKKSDGGVKVGIKLLEISRDLPVTKWDLEEDEKLPFATERKDEGNKYFKEGNWEEAEKKYAQTIEIVEWDKSPRRLDLKVLTLYNMALALMHQKRFVSALERINWAINIKPKEAKGYYRKATIYLTMGEYERAEEELMKALDIEPGNTEVRGQLDKVRTEREKYFKSSVSMYKGIFGKGVYENRRKSEYSDSLNRLVEIEICLEETAICAKIELFGNILPDACNYLERLVEARTLEGYTAAEVSGQSYVLFDLPSGEGGEDILEDRQWENKSTKIKDGGYVFMWTDEKGKYRSRLGISLAPLPWFDGVHVAIGQLCSPVDIVEKITEMIGKWREKVSQWKEAEDKRKGGLLNITVPPSRAEISLRNIRMF